VELKDIMHKTLTVNESRHPEIMKLISSLTSVNPTSVKSEGTFRILKRECTGTGISNLTEEQENIRIAMVKNGGLPGFEGTLKQQREELNRWREIYRLVMETRDDGKIRVGRELKSLWAQKNAEVLAAEGVKHINKTYIWKAEDLLAAIHDRRVRVLARLGGDGNTADAALVAIYKGGVCDTKWETVLVEGFVKSRMKQDAHMTTCSAGLAAWTICMISAIMHEFIAEVLPGCTAARLQLRDFQNHVAGPDGVAQFFRKPPSLPPGDDKGRGALLTEVRTGGSTDGSCSGMDLFRSRWRALNLAQRDANTGRETAAKMTAAAEAAEMAAAAEASPAAASPAAASPAAASASTSSTEASPAVAVAVAALEQPFQNFPSAKSVIALVREHFPHLPVLDSKTILTNAACKHLQHSSGRMLSILVSEALAWHHSTTTGASPLTVDSMLMAMLIFDFPSALIQVGQFLASAPRSKKSKKEKVVDDPKVKVHVVLEPEAKDN
jgi:nucleoid-associated protein YgaU